MAGPLAGVRVLETSTVLAGPIACQIMADFGADVIKIEHPDRGDSTRDFGPKKDGYGLVNEVINRNKRSVSLYLGDPEAAGAYRRLAANVDVVVENFRPGVMEKWGLGYDVLSANNPGLVMAHISGFGREGPYAQRPAFGTVAECMSGFAHMVGQAEGPPTLGIFGLADNFAANAAVIGILIALWARDRNGGKGQEVDVSLLRPIMSTLGAAVTWYQQLGYNAHRRGNTSENSSPRNTYQCADGKWVGLAGVTASTAARVITWAGRPDLVAQEWFADSRSDPAHAAELDAAVAHKIRQMPRDDVVRECLAMDIPLSPVYSPKDIAEDPNLLSAGVLAELAHPVLGNLLMPGLLANLSTTPGAIRAPAPALGEHTDDLLAACGIAPDEIASMRRRGVLR